MENIVSILSNEGLVIMPCDTVYGIIGIYPATDNKIREIKGRGENKPFLILIKKEWIHNFTKIKINNYLLNLWPGPLTIIVPGLNNDTIALRVPDDKRLQKLLLELKKPLYSTSVNKSGQQTLETEHAIESEFGNKVDLFVKEGDLIGSRPSTIIDITQLPYKILRNGACPVDLNMLML